MWTEPGIRFQAMRQTSGSKEDGRRMNLPKKIEVKAVEQNGGEGSKNKLATKNEDDATK